MKLRGRSHTKLVIKRDPMISVGCKRVSKKRPGRICGKPTYCGFSQDEGMSHVHPETVATSTQPHAGDSSPFSWRPLVFLEKFAAYIIIDVAQTLSP